MTEREYLLKILERIGLTVYKNEKDFIEFQSGCGYGTFIVDFDTEEKIIDIY